MSIMRISADYRADGMERAVVGFDNDSGRWTLEEGYVTAPCDARTFVVTSVDYFDTDAQASEAQRERGYR